MRNYHVITPFSRWENFGKYVEFLKREGTAAWHVLLSHKESIPESVQGFLREPWIAVSRIAIEKYTSHMGRALVNRFIGGNRFIDQDRYIILPDDDWFEPGFFGSLDQHDSQVLVVSMMRGHQVPTGSNNPCWNLIAGKEALHYGHTAIEQGIFSGYVLNNSRHRKILSADPDNTMDFHNEDLLFSAADEFPTEYLPEINVWFNYLEEGRWNK